MKQTSEPEFAARKGGGGKRVQAGGDMGTNGVCLLVTINILDTAQHTHFFVFHSSLSRPLEILTAGSGLRGGRTSSVFH
jgi:hypothetical protein